MNENLEAQLLNEFGTATFSSRDPKSRRLGLHKTERDPRDWKLEVSGRTSGIQHWGNPIQLDQGEEGACVGFAHTGVINAAPEVHELGNATGYRLYNIAKTLDPWPGEDYEGTSNGAGAKAAMKLGYYSGYAFSRDVEAIAMQVLNKGAATIGVDWYYGMDRVDSEGYVHPTRGVRGGHCVVIDGVVWGVFGEEDRFRIRNSWGPDWGFNGRCRLSAPDLQFLLDQGGDAVAPVEVS